MNAARAKQHIYPDNSSSTTRGAPVKQHNYGDTLSSPSRGVSYGDHLNSRAGLAKQPSYSDHLSTASKQHNYGDSLNTSAREASVKTHAFGDTSNSSSRAAPQHNYVDSVNAANKHHVNSNHREVSGAGVGPAKAYMFPNQYAYETMCPPLPNQYNYGDKGPMQQYGYKPDSMNQAMHQMPHYHVGLGRYGQHNGMGGQGRGWNQRGRPPMRGFQRSQWPPPGPPPGTVLPTGPMVHPHMGHPGHMAPLMPPFGHPPPPRGFYGPRPLPLFGHQVSFFTLFFYLRIFSCSLKLSMYSRQQGDVSDQINVIFFFHLQGKSTWGS